MQLREYALRFIDAVDDDLYIVDALLGDPEAPDSGIGFHCQQAVEKLLKALLAERGVHFRRSHDLGYLFHLVAGSGAPAPAHLEGLASLYSFAAILQYGSLGAVPAFDRRHTRQLIEELRAWVTEQVTAP